jgi:hypothetical protein
MATTRKSKQFQPSCQNENRGINEDHRDNEALEFWGLNDPRQADSQVAAAFCSRREIRLLSLMGALCAEAGSGSRFERRLRNIYNLLINNTLTV